MTQTPKTPQNPFEFLASLANPQGGAGVPFIFDLNAPRPSGAGSKNSGVDEVLGLFQNLVRDLGPDTFGQSDKPEASEDTVKPAPKCDKRPTAYGDVSIQIPLVGVPKENISIEVLADTILVKATVPDYVDVPASKREIEKYERLPLNVDVEKITSTHKDGLLTINLPAIKPTKVKIDISEG